MDTEKNENNHKKEKQIKIEINTSEKGRSKKTIIAIAVIVAIVLIVFAISFASCNGKFGSIGEFFSGKEGEVKTITKSDIQDVFEISELQSADYIYNAVASVYDENGELKYYVAYEGTVTAGIDFSKIEILVEDDSKTIKVFMPEVMITDTVVNAGTLSYIFEDDEYDNEYVFNEAYSVCQQDLDERAKNEASLLELAKENAKQIIEALLVPWIEQVNAEYTIEIN